MKQEINLSEKNGEPSGGGLETAVSVEAQPEKTLLEALEEQNIFLEGGCSGKGRCGRCRVRYRAGAPLPSASERHFFSAQELRSGWRLACLHKVVRKCLVEVAFVRPAVVEIVAQAPLGTEPGAEESGKGALKKWCISIDLGTTTIAMQARGVADGKLLGVWKAMNPQRRFGSDVISRMQAAREGHGGELQNAVEKVLSAGIRQLTEQVQGKDCKEREEKCAESDGELCGIYLAGNTVMEHLLAGLCVEGLSCHPFTPVTLEEQSLRLGTAEVTLLPGLSAFVGADILAGVLACGMSRREEVSLLIDLGTNGELVLGNREKLLCTATAAGPAFEGGPGNAAPGTDMIAVIAELMEAGVVDETGLLAEPWFETGISWQPGTRANRQDRAAAGNGAKEQILMTQEQIRAVQMAKAAIYAGICVLAREYGIDLPQIAHVWLAGGFGYFLDVEKAAKIGLFPQSLEGRVEAVGNTSLAGAYLYGRNGGKEEAARIRKICRAINLAGHPGFEEIYLEHLNLN